MDLLRRLVHAHRLERVEIALLDAPGLDRDLGLLREALAHHRRAFELRADAVRVDVSAAIDRHVDARDRELALGVDRGVHDRRDVAQEAPVHGDAAALAIGQLAAPARFLGHELDDAAQPFRIDRVQSEIVAVVPELGALLPRIDDARRTDQREEIVLGVLAGGMRHLAGHRLHREGVRHVRDRAEPAEAHARLGLARLAAEIGDVERIVDEAHPHLERAFVAGIGLEDREQRRRHAAVAPGHRLAAGVEARFDPLDRDRVVIIVPEVVLARPLHADRHAGHRLGDDRRLDREIGLRFAPEAAAEERGVDRHVLGFQLQHLGSVVARGLRALHAGPHLALATLEQSRRRRRLHRRVRVVRDVVLGLDLLGSTRERLIDIAAVAHRFAGLGRGGAHLGLILGRVVRRVGPVVPIELQGFASLDRGPGVGGDHGDAALRVELRRRRRARDLHHFLDAGDFHRRRGVEAAELAAMHRRARDDGVLHAGQAHVDAVLRLAGDDVEAVDDRRTLADVAELLRPLQRELLDRRHRHRGGFHRQLAVAELLARGLVHDLVHVGLDFFHVDAPALGGGGLEHHARGGADFAHRLHEVARAARAVGILVAVALFVAGGLDDFDLLPIRLELLGDDERNTGAHALPHLGAVADDADRAVRRDRDEDARIVDRAVRHAGGADLGLIGPGRSGGKEACGENEAAAGRDAFEQAAAAQIFDAITQHGAHPAACLMAARMRT